MDHVHAQYFRIKLMMEVKQAMGECNGSETGIGRVQWKGSTD